MVTKFPRPFPLQQQLEAERIRRGHSYKFLADSIGIGSNSNLAAGLQGRTNPQIDTLMKVANFYNLNIITVPKGTQ